MPPDTPPGKALAALPKLDLRILSDGRAGHEAQMFGIASPPRRRHLGGPRRPEKEKLGADPTAAP